MWETINRKLLPMKAHYFLFNAGAAAVHPFMTVYAKQLGFSSSVVGVIFGILPVVGMFSKMSIGAVADRLRLRKALLIAFIALAITSYFVLQFVPDVKKVTTNQATLHCNRDTFVEICSELTKKKCIDDKLHYKGAIQCVFDCDLTSQLVNEVCNTWGVSNICSLAGNKTTFNDLGNHDPSEGKSSYPTESTPARLEFTGDVLLNTSDILNECVIFHLSSSVFADKTSHLPYCKGILKTKCNMTCDYGTVNQLMRNVTEIGSEVYGTYQFWLFFWLMILSWVGMAVIVTLSDAICFELLGDNGRRYGDQRVWGSVGWGIMGLISGLLVDYFSEGEFEKTYTSAFYLLLILWFLDIFCAHQIKHEQSKISRSIWLDVGQLLLNPHILIFMLSCIVVGMCTGLQWTFLYWYLEELATGDDCDGVAWIKTLQGLVGGFQNFLGEVPYFFLSGWVLERVGHIHCMSLILFLLSIRFLLYSFLTNAWWTLPIELFQGVYGLFYPTMAGYANAVAPPGTEATVQGLVGAAFEGIGVASGAFLAGISYNSLEGAMTFRIFGMGALVACGLHVGAQYLLSKRLTRSHPKGFTGLSSGNEAVAMLDVT